MGGFQRRKLAVVLSIIIVTGSIAPLASAAMAESGYPAINRGDDIPNNTDYDNHSALELKNTALASIAMVSDDEADMERPRELVSGTRDQYRGLDRITSESVFDTDAKAIKQLSQFSQQSPRYVDESTWLLAKADARSANTSVTDANRAFETFGDDIENSGQHRKTERKITNAKRAYEKGTALLEADDQTVKEAADDRARALRHFATAWRHSQAALDVLESETEPRVTIETRNDPIRNGSEPAERNIAGTVEAVRPHNVETITVRVNDTEPIEIEPVSLAAVETRAVFSSNREFSEALAEERGISSTSAVFVTNVTFDERINEVTATVDGKSATAGSENAHTDRRKSNGPPDEKGDNSPPKDTSGNGPPVGDSSPDDGDRRSTSRSDTVVFDGDGLSDAYERETTGTDPLDPDSDSPKTDRDESDNGIIDGLEDFDDDSLKNTGERVFGTDPFDADTDGDGLDDIDEARYTELDPTDSDSNDNGTLDARDDPDEDGLTTAREIELGTHPLEADTDDDELTDDEEVDRYETEPATTDTDDDGLSDGAEIRLDTDPLVPDTDGDGVLDGNETFTTSAADEALGVELELTGQGDVASGVAIDEANRPELETDAVRNASASQLISLESERSFDHASVTIEYDEAAAGNESNLSVFRFNETLGTFEPLNTTVDESENTVTATTPGFSTFAVFNVENWASIFSADLPNNRGTNATTEYIDTAFIIDSSGSMSGNDPDEYRKTASKRFISGLIEGDRATVIDFDSNAYVDQPLTTDFDAVNASIDGLDASGGTDIAAGIREAIREYDRNSNESRGKVAILLTDGRASTAPAKSAARRAAERDIPIYPIGFGDPDDQLMREIADITGTEYNKVDSAEDLPEVFERVSNETTQFVDSDGDGLSDELESGPIYTGTGGLIDLDPNDPDTDNDGLSDGQELGQRVESYVYGDYYNPVTDPTSNDGDGDGLTDYEETRTHPELDPQDANTDGDGRDDGDDPEPLVPVGEESSADDASFFDESGDVATNAVKGAVLGDAGLKYNVDGSDTLEYFGGWLALSIAPTVDVAADVRDCVVVNSDIEDNLLDCGGAVISAGGSIGTVVGGLTAPTGLGAALGAGSFALDTAEDVADVVSLTVRWVRHAPTHAAAAGQLVYAKVGDRLGDVIERIVRRLDDDLAAEFTRHIDRQRLVRAGLDDDTARALQDVPQRVGMSADEVAQLAARVDGLDAIEPINRRHVVLRLANSDDAVKLTDAYEADTLSKIASAGGSGGDDLLTKAADAADAGKADEIARLADELNRATLDTVLRIGRISEAATLLSRTDNGGTLLNTFDSAAVDDFLSYGTGRADDMREAVVVATYKVDDFEGMTPAVAEEFAKSARHLEDVGTPGHSSMIDEYIAKNVDTLRRGEYSATKGAIYESIVNAQILGTNDLTRMSKTTPVLTDGADITTTIRVFEQGDGYKTIEKTVDASYEIDRWEDGTRTVTEMKSGSIPRQDTIAKLIRFRRFLTDEVGIPPESVDEHLVYVVNDADDLTGPVKKTIEEHATIREVTVFKAGS